MELKTKLRHPWNVRSHCCFSWRLLLIAATTLLLTVLTVGCYYKAQRTRNGTLRCSLEKKLSAVAPPLPTYLASEPTLSSGDSQLVRQLPARPATPSSSGDSQLLWRLPAPQATPSSSGDSQLLWRLPAPQATPSSSGDSQLLRRLDMLT